MTRDWIRNRFAGQTVFVVGGGPSLKGFRFELLKDRPCICVNDSVAFVPSPALWVIYEQDVLERRPEALGKVPLATRFEAEPGVPFLPLDPYSETDKVQTDLEDFVKTGRIYSRYQTGHIAVNLALLGGARRVILLGFDQRFLDAAAAQTLLDSLTLWTHTLEGLMFFQSAAAPGADLGAPQFADARHFYSGGFATRRIRGRHPEDGNEAVYTMAAKTYSRFKDFPVEVASPISLLPLPKIRVKAALDL